MHNELLRKSVSKIDKLVAKGRIPLGTRKPYHYYFHKEIKESDIVWMPYSAATSPENILILAGTGQMKTVLMKRLAYYHKLRGYNVFVCEPKLPEWDRARYRPKNYGLHPVEKPTTLPIINFVPSFIIKKLPPEAAKGFKVITSDMNTFEEAVYWYNLNFTATATDYIRQIVEKGKLDTPKALIKFIRTKKMHGGTKQSLMRRLQTLDDVNLFDYTYGKLDRISIKKYWNKGLIPVVTLFSKKNEFVSLCIGHILDEIYNMHLENPKHPEFLRKFIVIDDASKVIGVYMKEDEFISVEIIMNGLNLWRFAGFRFCFATQSPALINPDVIDACKWFMIAKIGNTELLKKYCYNPEIIETIKKLRYEPKKYIIEYVLVHPDKFTYETFFPFLSPVGHFVS